MDPRDDDDIEFDFFEDEPATTEAAQPSRVRLPRRGGSGTGRRGPGGPSRGLTPLLRLLGAVIVLVALLVVFGLAIQSCAGTSKHDEYSGYMDDVAKIAHGSQDDGQAVSNALTSGAKPGAMADTLNGIADQERQNLAQAQKLDPPGPLRPENQQVIEALQLRISGTDGLAKAFGDLAASPKAKGDAAALSAQGDRLVASDVVWADLFQAPSAAEMQDQGVQGVQPPSSVYVQNRQLYTETSLTLLLQRLQGTSSTGKVTGLHGTGLLSTVANPGGAKLSTGTENTVTATTDLAFVATVEDTGDFQEVGIQVTMTLQKDTGGHAIVQTQKISVINPKQQKTVTFSGINVSGYFAVKSHLSIDVKPVPGETNLDNNKASYPVIFSLG
jgi:hypothetical protein